MNKQYLGDSVYVEIDRGSIKLTTENGMPTDPSNVIWLEPAVYVALVDYVARMEVPRDEGADRGDPPPA